MPAACVSDPPGRHARRRAPRTAPGAGPSPIRPPPRRPCRRRGHRRARSGASGPRPGGRRRRPRPCRRGRPGRSAPRRRCRRRPCRRAPTATQSRWDALLSRSSDHLPSRRPLPELAGRPGRRVELPCGVGGQVPDVLDLRVGARGGMLGVGHLDHLAARPGARRRPCRRAVDGQRQGLGVGRVVGRRSRRPRPSVAGGRPCPRRPWRRRRRRRPVRARSQTRSAASVPGGHQRLAEPDPAAVGDHHALAVALGEGRGPFLPPGLELGPGRAQPDQRASDRQRPPSSSRSKAREAHADRDRTDRCIVVLVRSLSPGRGPSLTSTITRARRPWPR